MREGPVHEAMVKQLESLKNKEYPNERAFLKDALPMIKNGDEPDANAAIRKKVLKAAAVSNRFKITDRSLTAMRDQPIPEDVLAKIEALHDHDYLTRDLLIADLNPILDDAVESTPERNRIRGRVLGDAENRKIVGKLFSIFRANTPQLYIDLNRDQCHTMGVDPRDVFSTLQIYLGSYYVNDFNQFGRTWQVVVQARGKFRDDKEKIKQLKVRNKQGEMVPLGAVVAVKEKGGPINIGRYNMYHAAAILVATEDGISSGQGIQEMEAICNEILPPGMTFEWTEINYMQIDAANNIWNRLIFPLAVVFVFLVLAAQYESWSLPLAVILVVPMCILGSLTGVWISGDDINIFTQIGFVVLVGLASKNAILIVEFAKHRHEEGGLPRKDATLAACQLRLRPILMTSFSFILGVTPLLVTTGAGAEMRRTLGTAVFAGMLGVTLFGIFLTPVFFYVIAGFADAELFTSARMRAAGQALKYTLAIATLGIPWLVMAACGKVLRRPAPIEVHALDVVNGKVETNGTLKPADDNGVPVATRKDGHPE
jgi:hypothetical protein